MFLDNFGHVGASWGENAWGHTEPSDGSLGGFVTVIFPDEDYYLKFVGELGELLQYIFLFGNVKSYWWLKVINCVLKKVLPGGCLNLEKWILLIWAVSHF